MDKKKEISLKRIVASIELPQLLHNIKKLRKIQKRFATNPNDENRKELVKQFGIYLDTKCKKMLEEKDISKKCIILKNSVLDLEFTLSVFRSGGK